MKATGKSTEAKELKKGLRTTDATRGISEKLDAAMQEGVKANRGRRFDEAQSHYKEAVDLAEKLQPTRWPADNLAPATCRSLCLDS